MSSSTYNCTTTSTTLAPCTNPIVYLFEEAKKLYDTSDGNYATLGLAVQALLLNGIVTDSCNVCCPDCDEYVLARIDRYLQYYNVKYPIPAIPGPIGAIEKTDDNIEFCCRNLFSNIDSYITFIEGINYNEEDVNKFRTCCNGFTTCLNDMINYFSDNNCTFIEYGGLTEYFDILNDILLQSGIVEQSGINGQSQICTIFNLFKEFTNCGCFLQDFIRILEDGIVITCDSKNRLFIGTVEGWINYKQLFID